MFWERLTEICLEKGISPNGLCKAIGLSDATATKWKYGSIPNNSTLLKISNKLGVSIDYLLGKTDIKEKTPALSEEDGDIADGINRYLEILERQEALMFDGEPLDDESKELLLISLKNTMELAKKMKERKKSGLLDNK